MEFDGSGDYFSGTYNADFNFGTGDFTIEMWGQPKTVNSIDGLFALMVVVEQSKNYCTFR